MTSLNDIDGQRSSKRILSYAGFTVATLLALANAIWQIDSDVNAFLAFSAACSGFAMGERFGKTTAKPTNRQID